MNIGEHGFFLPGTNNAGVLLIHGLAGTPTEIRYIGRELNQAGFTVFAPQLAGHCSTEADLLKTNWQDWADTVIQAYHELQEKVEFVFAGGLSMGAVLSLYLASIIPEKIKGLALYSTTLRWDGWAISKFSFMLPLILRLPFGKSYHFVEAPPYGIKDERLRQRILTQMQSGDAASAGHLGTPGSSVLQLRQLVAVVKKRLPEITTPALILHAQNDDITSTWNANYLEKHLGGPTRKIFLDESYHMITIDQQRDEVAQYTINFFQSLLKQSSILEKAPSVL